MQIQTTQMDAFAKVMKVDLEQRLTAYFRGKLLKWCDIMQIQTTQMDAFAKVMKVDLEQRLTAYFRGNAECFSVPNEELPGAVAQGIHSAGRARSSTKPLPA